MPIDEPLIYHHPLVATYDQHRFTIRADNPSDPRSHFTLYSRSMGLSVNCADRDKLKRVAELLLGGGADCLTSHLRDLDWKL